MKQATYAAEVQSRLQYQKALTAVVDIVQERCRDTRLVEDILGIADSCEGDFLGGHNEVRSPSRSHIEVPAASRKASSSESGLMSSIRSLWS